MNFPVSNQGTLFNNIKKGGWADTVLTTLAILILLFFGYLGIQAVNNYFSKTEREKFAVEGVQTTAKVVMLKHWLIRGTYVIYEFYANGELLRQHKNFSDRNPQLKTINIGDCYVVTYAKSSPVIYHEIDFTRKVGCN